MTTCRVFVRPTWNKAGRVTLRILAPRQDLVKALFEQRGLGTFPRDGQQEKCTPDAARECRLFCSSSSLSEMRDKRTRVVASSAKLDSE